MRVLVAYASKHGATQGIAERIGERLADAGLTADVRVVTDAPDPADYDAFVVGSATYLTHWRKEATDFAAALKGVVAGRPVWLFSSGPLGAPETDAQGRQKLAAAEPKDVPELHAALSPRDHHVFFGALDPQRLTLAERALRKLPAGREMLPEGDFRDWAEIDAWAAGIAEALTQA